MTESKKLRGCLTIDDLKWRPLEQKEPVTIVAQGITLRVCGNRFQRLLKKWDDVNGRDARRFRGGSFLLAERRAGPRDDRTPHPGTGADTASLGVAAGHATPAGQPA